jgi:HEXXH motif-containing protein
VIAEALVHEAAHALLFGFGMGKPLVTNKTDELYTSPIRNDPRPMDGVIHATYVLARMHYAGLCLLESNLLTYEEEQVAREEQERHMHYYARGAAVIETHARWTEVGEAALNSARAYMTTAQ